MFICPSVCLSLYILCRHNAHVARKMTNTDAQLSCSLYIQAKCSTHIQWQPVGEDLTVKRGQATQKHVKSWREHERIKRTDKIFSKLKVHGTTSWRVQHHYILICLSPQYHITLFVSMHWTTMVAYLFYLNSLFSVTITDVLVWNCLRGYQ